MDVVRTRVETLGGHLALKSSPGSGLAVEIRLPLTIVVVQAFVIEAGGQVFAVPISSVERTIELGSDAMGGPALVPSAALATTVLPRSAPPKHVTTSTRAIP
jgi:chemotaxis protein histidine kinase CheA